MPSHLLLSQQSAMSAQEETFASTQVLNEWKIITFDSDRKGVIRVRAFFTLTIFTIWLAAGFFIWVGPDDALYLVSYPAISATVLFIYFLNFTPQKNLYHYTLFDHFAKYSFCPYFHRDSRLILRYFIMGCFIFVIILAVQLDSMEVLLLGSLYLIFNGALHLLYWKAPDPELVNSPPWGAINSAIIDKKNRIIALVVDDTTAGFEMYLHDHEHLERCLVFLKRHLPQHVAYIERCWRQ